MIHILPMSNMIQSDKMKKFKYIIKLLKISQSYQPELQQDIQLNVLQ
jgi:hypothetical protein